MTSQTGQDPETVWVPPGPTGKEATPYRLNFITESYMPPKIQEPSTPIASWYSPKAGGRPCVSTCIDQLPDRSTAFMSPLNSSLSQLTMYSIIAMFCSQSTVYMRFAGS